MLKPRILHVLFVLCLSFTPVRWLPAADSGKAEHVVVIVWDGMRPDFITPHTTPNLYSLATKGVFFKRHHAAYISTTEVNGTALATGAHPAHSGIIANSDYRPEIALQGTNATEGLENIRRGDVLSQGNYLLVPTVAETLQKAGITTAIAGTKPVALLHDRQKKKLVDSGIIYNGTSIPRSLLELAVKENDNKGFPASAIPNKDRDAWTTRALIKVLWRPKIPKYSLLWLAEPDASQHDSGPGSANALAALESSDKQLGEVLKALDDRKIRDKTDVMVVSDHGFATIGKSVDVFETLKKAKFPVFKRFEDPEPGDILVVGLGGSFCFYVYDHVEATTRKLAEFLQTTEFAGVIFSRPEVKIEGAFPLDAVALNAPTAEPDLVMALRWNADKNESGTAGLIFADGAKGKGTHGSLSPFEMRNTLVASGPDFKVGFINETPSGNIDVPPTVLHLLGIKQNVPMDGRVLHEALVDGPATTPSTTKTIEATRELALFRWRQYLKFTTAGNAIYFDEGNGEPAPR
jgi:predicted AlkP superfamily pyrophosphatase or phosphodiesterase